MEFIRSRSDRDCVLELAMQIPYIRFHANMRACVSDTHICFYFSNPRDFYAVSCGYALYAFRMCAYALIFSEST